MMETPFFCIPTMINASMDAFKRTSGHDVSAAFLLCANEKLIMNFEALTGIKVNKHIGVSSVNAYHKGQISDFDCTFYVNHNWIPVKICCRSKSGNDYNIDDRAINCEDVDFWFQGLDIALIYKLLYPKDPVSFKMKHLTYDLEVVRTNTDVDIEMTIYQDHVSDIHKISIQVDHFISQFNEKSEKEGRKSGLVHNRRFTTESNAIKFSLDLGSAGVPFIKKLLKFLSDLAMFTKVKIE